MLFLNYNIFPNLSTFCLFHTFVAYLVAPYLNLLKQYHKRIKDRKNLIKAKVVILRYGIPYAYYVDSYSVYRLVQGSDSIWRNHYKFTIPNFLIALLKLIFKDL